MSIEQEQTAPARPHIGGREVVAVLLVALCLRSAITAVGPLLGRIGDDTGLSDTVLGLLSALPVLAFGVVSPFVQRPARRIGAERLIGLALLLTAVGVAVRSLPALAPLWIGTAALGSGIAVCNVMLPAVVRRDFAERAALLVGSYSAVMGAAAALASGIALPLAVAFDGSWRWSLVIWAVPALLSAVFWLLRRRRDTATSTTSTTERSAVWRTALAWRLSLYMGLQSTTFYVLVAWLPSILATHGISHTAGGWYLFGFQVVGILAGLAVPLLLRRVERHLAAALTTLPMLVGLLGFVVLPGAAVGWAALAGVGSGASLVMALSLFSLDADDPTHAAALSGMGQSIGYLIAAGGPIAAGALHDTTGSWTTPLVGLVVVAALQGVVIIVRRRTAIR